MKQRFSRKADQKQYGQRAQSETVCPTSRCRNHLLTLFATASIAWIASTIRAEVRPHGLFSDHAVIQRDVDVPVWGSADNDEPVTVEFQDQKLNTVAKDGKWKVTLKPMSAGGPFSMKIAGPGNSVTISDILIGEVWVCSGQSNMAWGLGGCETKDQIATHAHLPNVRLFQLKQNPQEHPVSDVSARWAACTPNNAYGFSAAGYYFGRDLQRAINVPVGLIQSAAGGTLAHTWMPAKYLENDPKLAHLLNFWEETKAAYAKRLARYQAEEPQLLKKYEEDLAKARAEGKLEPKKPAPPGDNPAIDFRRMTAANYNGSIHPLQPYAIRGAIWYQGESDAGRPNLYRVTLSTMIHAWRETWGQGDFAFLIVQLPAYGVIDDPRTPFWAMMREVQADVGRTSPNAYTVVTIDCGNSQNTTDLHPPIKEPIGSRLALAARANVYRESVEYSGPVYDGMTIQGDRIELRFKHTGDELVGKDGQLKGFTIAGQDKQFVAAEAKIDGDRVIVWNPHVQKPAFVRYGWANYPVCTLYNKAGLPAAPFRADDLPLAADAD